MNTERNCQSCKYYKYGYCENLELKPCYPSKGCGDFSKREALEQEPVLDKIRAELIQSIQNGTLKIESGNEVLFRIIDKYKAESEE